MLTMSFNNFFQGFYTFAKYEDTGKNKLLVHGGYRYHKNREFGGSVHWICTTYKRTGCRGRATTRLINCIEMMRLNAPHSHPPE